MKCFLSHWDGVAGGCPIFQMKNVREKFRSLVWAFPIFRFICCVPSLTCPGPPEFLLSLNTPSPIPFPSLFLLHHAAFRVLVPQPGIEPVPSALQATREVSQFLSCDSSLSRLPLPMLDSASYHKPTVCSSQSSSTCKFIQPTYLIQLVSFQVPTLCFSG